MESTTSTVLAKRDASTALMPPPPKPKRVRRPPTVLDEETYTTALEYIIARDFYPGLLETKTLSDYLDALEGGDEAYIAEKEKIARTIMNTPRAARPTPRLKSEESPYVGIKKEFMTPLSLSVQTPLPPSQTPTSSTPAAAIDSEQLADHRAPRDQAGNKVDLQISLSEFQARYTSEDNESFYKIVDRQNLKKAASRAWYHTGNKLPSKRQLAQATAKRLLEAGTTTHKLTPRPSDDQDARPAGIDARPQHSKQGPKNALMFPPDSIADTHPELTSQAEIAERRSNAPPKAVNYGNTRLESQNTHSQDSQDNLSSAGLDSPSLSAIDAVIGGHPAPRRASTIATESLINQGDEEDEPGVSGYAYVDADPTPSEVALFRDGPPVPSLLDELVAANRDSPSANAFTLQGPSKRESLRDKLVEKQLAQRRTPLTHLRSSNRLDSLRAGETPKFLSSPITPLVGRAATPGNATPMRKTGTDNLTPAARKLYDTLGKTPGRSRHTFSGRGSDHRSREGSSFDSNVRRAGERGAWTPTPLRIKKAD